MSRDPIAERGGLNLYGFWENNLNDNVDAVGLQGYIGWVPPTEMPYPLLLHPIPPQSYPVPAFPLSVVDNKLNLNVKETSDLSWFQNDPDASRAMQRAKEYYEENIKKNRSLVCQGMMPTIPSFYSGTTQSAHYQESLLKLQKQTGKIEPEWPIPQGAFWSKVVLGSVEWRLTGFKTKKDGSLLYWEAEVSIVDKLGWEAAAYNPWPAMEKLAGPSREIVRGRFHVGGRMCCTSTAPSSSLTPLIVTP